MFGGWDEFHLINRGLYELVENLPKSDLGEVISYVLSSPGKRVRPLILLFSWRGFGGGDLHALNAALAVELVHAASLVHDDILDLGLKRRGVPSALERFGSDAALLAGDYLISKSIELISSYPSPVIKAFAKACLHMSEGEMLDLLAASSPQNYYGCIYKKTASLFAASAQIGCMIAGAPEPEIARLANYGMHLGLGYQILDDLEEHLGIDQGKSSNKVSRTLPGLYNSKHTAEEAIAMCIEAVDNHRAAARQALKDSSCDPTMKERLGEIIDQMTLRGLSECRSLKSLC